MRFEAAKLDLMEAEPTRWDVMSRFHSAAMFNTPSARSWHSQGRVDLTPGTYLHVDPLMLLIESKI